MDLLSFLVAAVYYADAGRVARAAGADIRADGRVRSLPFCCRCSCCCLVVVVVVVGSPAAEKPDHARQQLVAYYCPLQS